MMLLFTLLQLAHLLVANEIDSNSLGNCKGRPIVWVKTNSRFYMLPASRLSAEAHNKI